MKPITLSNRIRKLKTQGKINTRRIRQGNSNSSMVTLNNSENEVQNPEVKSRLFKVRVTTENEEKVCESSMNILIHEGDFRKMVSVLLSPQLTDQILNNKGFKEQLELYYPQIYTITCVIARFFREIYSNESDQQVFNLTHALIETGTHLAISDLMPKGILKEQCKGCFYPFNDRVDRSDLTEFDQRAENKAVCDSEEQNIMLTNSNRSLSDQIIQFIKINKEGATKGAIYAYFQQLDYPDYEINDTIINLINIGTIYQRDSGKYMLL